MFSLADRALALRLGVSLEPYGPICHGLACGCWCEECKAIREQPSPPEPEPSQPWEPKVRAA